MEDSLVVVEVAPSLGEAARTSRQMSHQPLLSEKAIKLGCMKSERVKGYMKSKHPLSLDPGMPTRKGMEFAKWPCPNISTSRFFENFLLIWCVSGLIVLFRLE
tara:strand:+ start:66 stop:374 length:309 start_codon:yes stop_codon:yes gene_type:complete